MRQMLSRKWRCSWSSADRRCSNYIWVINNFIAYQGAIYIRNLSVCILTRLTHGSSQNEVVTKFLLTYCVHLLRELLIRIRCLAALTPFRSLLGQEWMKMMTIICKTKHSIYFYHVVTRSCVFIAWVLRKWSKSSFIGPVVVPWWLK